MEPGGRRLRRPERGPKAQGSIGPCVRDGPPRKSYSGAGETQDTACPRGENPGAARHPPPRSRRLVATAASQTTRGVRRNDQTAGGSEAWKHDAHPRTAGSRLRRVRTESHERRRAATPVQVARTVAAGPVRHRETKPVTNDPPRRRLQRKVKERRREARKTARAHATRWVPGRTKRRSGMVRGTATPRTARRDRRTLTGPTRGNLTRVDRTNLPDAGGNSTGR